MNPKTAILIVSVTWLIAGISYYPKWKLTHSEAAISWDVSGYYHYLPAIFIYHDITHQHWMDDINARYLPSPAYDQTVTHPPTGLKVNKYWMGQAVLYAPFFLITHVITDLCTSYPADGYSRPYQISMWLSSLGISILGLFLLGKILTRYYTPVITGWVILILGLATNYFEYAAISNGMNHTWLFTLLCALIWMSIRFYEKSDWTSAISIGVIMGLVCLTRPTEIIWALIPLCWNMDSISGRLRFLQQHVAKLLLVGIIAGLFLFLQPLYWKLTIGEWYYYTYQDQGFHWLRPAFKRGLLGANIGWLLYTPVMLLALFGFYPLYKNNRSIFWPTVLVSCLAIYITCCWSHFESGGGLGQRNLIQIYPLLAFPLAAWLSVQMKHTWRMWLAVAATVLCIYYNLCWVHQAHRGGFFQAGQMNRAYFLKVAGKIHPNKDYVKLLDQAEYFDGTPSNEKVLMESIFDSDTSQSVMEFSGHGKVMRLDGAHQVYGPMQIPVDQTCGPWLRLQGDFSIESREWDWWKFTQWIVKFYNEDEVVKTNFIRVQRLVKEDHLFTTVFFDVKFPEVSFTRCEMSLWNADSPHTILMDNLKISCWGKALSLPDR